MNDNYAEDVARQHADGTARTKATRSAQERAAQRILGILAHAEDAAKRGDEAERDRLLEQASVLQMKYAVDETMLRKDLGESAEKIIFMDFCEESNTPLIKAKRILINTVAKNHRGRAVMMGAYKTQKTGKKKGQQVWDRRAKVRVYAHESDLAFIRTLYTSLVLQMQSMMARDEQDSHAMFSAGTVPQAWRVSYAHGWVIRIGDRMFEIKMRTERQANQEAPGTALVLRDRDTLVQGHLATLHGTLRTTRYRTDDRDAAGKSAGYRAGGEADLGQGTVSPGGRRALPSA